MDWFERLTGFRETKYEDTRSRLEVVERQLRSLVNGKSYGIGELELVSLDSLRERVRSIPAVPGRLKLGVATGDVRLLHQAPQFAGALFQVASQFNLLEMTGPDVTPEHGVTRYQHDRTQGPACAIAAGAATIFRNYFAKVGAAMGQTSTRQIDGLAPVGNALATALGEPVGSLWEMRNGYAMCRPDGLRAISAHLRSLSPEVVEELAGKLCIGIHSDVEVTDAQGMLRPVVSQAFCSALPVAYSTISESHWQAFASLVLDAAYEATLLSAVLNAHRGASNVVLLTCLGGGAFGNEDEWIQSSMRRALGKAAAHGLDVRIVCNREPSRAVLNLVREFGQVESPR